MNILIALVFLLVIAALVQVVRVSELLAELNNRMPDWESVWGQSAWNGESQVSVHRPDLSN